VARVVALGPRLLMYGDHALSCIHLVFLFAVSMTPSSTTLLAGFTAFRLALVAYWLNILALGVTLYLLGVRAEVGAGKGRSAAAGVGGHQAARYRRAIAVRGGRAAVCFRHALEYRDDGAGAAQLCDRAEMAVE
jgi:hypothetical protein